MVKGVSVHRYGHVVIYVVVVIIILFPFRLLGSHSGFHVMMCSL